MFEQLQDRLARTFKTLSGQGKIKESNIRGALSEVRRSLLEADVHYRVVQSIIDRVRERAMGQEVLTHVRADQQFVKVLYDEIVRILGGEAPELRFSGRAPAVVLLLGLQGTGKTTTAAKLAMYLRDEMKRRPLMVPADLARPAAREQLMTLGREHGLAVYDRPGDRPLAVCQAALQAVREREVAADVLLIDTAGRLAVDEELMQELRGIYDGLKPSLSLYVLDAMSGQDALRSAESFCQHVPFDGVIATKLDGDSRGGAILSVRQTLDRPVYFIGSGEKVDNLERLHPDRMASRILGMGDIVSLVEKAQKVVDVQAAEKMAQKMRKNQFTIEDFGEQMQSVKKMGSLQDLVGMIPGGANLKQALAGGLPEAEMKRVEAIIGAMTPRERRQHQIIDGSRRKRIANGSGTTVADVNRFLKQFLQARKMMSRMGKMGMKGMRRGGLFSL